MIDISKYEYVGGGYFREPGPQGVSTNIIHAPEYVDILKKEMSELQAQITVLENLKKRILSRLSPEDVKRILEG